MIVNNDFQDWKYLLESAYHRENFHRVSNFVTLKKSDYVEGAESKSSYEICSTALLYQHFYTVFISLHLLYEVSTRSAAQRKSAP